MISEHQKRVNEFMKLAGQELPRKPTVPSEAVRWLRARLILEEAFETVTALGFELTTINPNKIQTHHIYVNGERAPFYAREPNLVEIIDGCCDLKVVTTGTLSACGVPDEIFQKEVDDNNLAKFAPGFRIDGYGKLLKPPGHKPPRIAELLAEQEGKPK